MSENKGIWRRIKLIPFVSMEEKRALLVKHLSRWDGIWSRYISAKTREEREKVLNDYRKCIQCADQGFECQGCFCGADACPGCENCTSEATMKEIMSLEPVEVA
jgi:hypothetical protein